MIRRFCVVMILLCVVTYNLALYVILTSTDFWSWDKFFVYFSRQHHFYKWNMQLSCFAYSINKLAWSIAPLFSLFILIAFLNAAKIEDVSDIAEFWVCNNSYQYEWNHILTILWGNIFVLNSHPIFLELPYSTDLNYILLLDLNLLHLRLYFVYCFTRLSAF